MHLCVHRGDDPCADFPLRSVTTWRTTALAVRSAGHNLNRRTRSARCRRGRPWPSMDDPHRTFQQHHPGTRRETSAPHHHACGHSHRPTADRATSGGRGTGARQRPRPAGKHTARASLRHHRPPRRHEPSHENRQHILLRLDDVPPRPSSATTCGLPVSFRRSNPAGGQHHPVRGHSQWSAAGPAPARSAAVTPPRSSPARRHYGADLGGRVTSNPHNCRSRAAPADRNWCHNGGTARPA